MALFDEIRKALMDLATSLPKINRENRKEIREIVLELQSELERSLTMAIFYLDGVSRIKPRPELLDHLYSAPMKLMDTYNQFKVCAGLYGLADRFQDVFSSLKGSIAVGQVSALENLVRDLSNGERMVMDGLRDMTGMLADFARQLDVLNGDDYDDCYRRLLDRVDLERKELKSQIEWLINRVLDVFTKM